MKLNRKFIVAALTLTAMLAVSLAASPGASSAKKNVCSLATLSGRYGSIQSGDVSGQPFTAVNLVISDGAGNITGTGNRSLNGAFVSGPITATYTVNADCTGTFTTSTGITQNLVITSDGELVQFIVTNAGWTVSGQARSLDD